MTLAKFYKELETNNGSFKDGEGKVIPITIWQHLTRLGDFEKVIEHNFDSFSAHDFTSMAKLPVYIPIPKRINPTILTGEVTAVLRESLYTKITFYPNTDKGIASIYRTDIRVHMYYYEI